LKIPSRSSRSTFKTTKRN